jgi:hypothetical protein
MPFQFQQSYPPDVAEHMRNCFASLSEKDRRRYAAVEVVQWGQGGITSISQLFDGSPELMEHGLQDLQQLPHDPAGERMRRPGGGKKKTEANQPEVLPHVRQTLAERTAGDPMRRDVWWTDVTPRGIALSVEQEWGQSLGTRVVRRLLDTLGLARRQIANVLPGGATADRDPPFRDIADLTATFLAAGNPVVRIDTKKKACLGLRYRHGNVYGQQAHKAFDHDVPRWAEGVIVPHGMYDLARNHGCLPGGLSRDTTAFACDSLRVYWETDGQHHSPHATELLL